MPSRSNQRCNPSLAKSVSVPTLSQKTDKPADKKEHRNDKVLAEYALKEIQQLYRIERMADERNLTFGERAELREELAAPIMKSLEAWMEKTYPTVLPQSLIGEAIGYSYSLWPRMKNYLKDYKVMI